jgi:hypothetical protein
MPDYTVKADVDSMLRADNDAGIRSAIGLGQTDAPTFGGLNLSNGWQFVTNSSFIRINSSSGGQGHIQIGAGYTILNSRQLSFQDATIFNTAANILEQRNGGSRQAFRVYNTYTSDTVYERAVMGWNATTGNLDIGTEFLGGSGMAAKPIDFVTGGVARWQISAAGHLMSAGVTDNLYDIGASGANRPKNIYLSGFISSELGYGKSGLSGASQGLQFSGSTTNIVGGAAGASVQLVTNDGTLYISCIPGLTRFVGTTSAFPAIKRSTTSLQARLADDSAFTNIQGKLTTDTAYTATVVVPTGFLTLYDSTGTAYRVPCVV